MLTFEIEEKKIPKGYNKEEIQVLFLHFLSYLQTKDLPLEIEEFEKKELPYDIQKTFEKYDDYKLEDFKKDGFFTI